MIRLIAALLMVLGLTLPAAAATFVPPGIDWRTFETAHFRIHFPSELRAVARKTARFAEESHAVLGPYFGRENDVTHVTILDTQDTTNGFATAFPQTSLTFFVTPPSPDEDWFVGRYDNWLKMVIAHEYTHVLHLRAAAGPLGVPGYINSMAIRAFLPEFSYLVNLDFLPDFMKEGLAVYQESAITGGGRALEGQFDMVIRSQFHAGQEFGIDQASGKYALDWSPGGAHYSYGTLFFKYLHAKKGEDAAARLTESLGHTPWLGINAASMKTFGESAIEIFDQMKAFFKERYASQVDLISRVALTESQAVTSDGRNHRHPHWLGNDRLAYTKSPLEGAAGLVSNKLDGTDEKYLLAKSSRKDYSVSADGKSIYYYTQGDGPALTMFYDIYRYDFSPERVSQVTHGLRASFPAASPKGDRILVVLGGGGRNDLGMIDRHGELQWRFKGPDFGSFSNPVWSPDGGKVAISHWIDGRTNVMIFDPEAKTLRAVAPEDAVQLGPTWSPDGNYIVFASDRTGVLNLHAVRLADGKRYRMTNVIGGTLDPAISPDGKQIAFVEYRARGYDVQVMPFKPSDWLAEGSAPLARLAAIATDVSDAGRILKETDYSPALPSRPLTPSALSEVAERDIAATDNPAEYPYSALTSLMPQLVWPRVVLDTDNPKPFASLPTINPFISKLHGGGPLFAVIGYGQDVLHQHTYGVAAGVLAGAMRPLYSLSYTNDQLPPSLSIGYSVFPGILGGQLVDSPYLQLIGREEKSVFAGISYPPIESPLVAGSWLKGITGNLNVKSKNYSMFTSLGGRNTDIPGLYYGVPGITGAFFPNRINSLSLSITGNSADKPQRAFSPAGGPLWMAGVERADPTLGSEIASWKGWAEGRYYLSAGGRNILALRGMTGVNFTDDHRGFQVIYMKGSRPFYNPNLFTVGQSELSTSSLGVSLGRATSVAAHDLGDLRSISEPDSSVPLRGFRPGTQFGTHATFFSAEYRIPILEVGRGIGTIPFFLERLTLAPFVDVGKAYTYGWNSAEILAGVGIETRAHIVLAQGIPSELRLGYAKGIGNLGVHQLILGLGAVF